MPIVQAVQQPDYGRIIRDALGVYQNVSQMEQEQSEREKIKRIEQLSKDVYEDPAAWKELKSLSPERAAQLEQMGNVKLDRFFKYRAQIALEIKDLPPHRQAQVLAQKAAELRAEGRDPTQTLEIRQRIMSGDKSVNDELKAYVEQGYQTGYLERPPQQKEKGTYKIATEQEKIEAGLDPKKLFQISPEGKFISLDTKGQTINVNMGDPGKIGTVPEGYALNLDPATNKYVMYEIKGGPADKKTEAQKKAENVEAETTGRSADLVQEDIGRLTGLIEKQKWYNPVTGLSAEYVFTNLPGTARKDAEGLRTTIATNIGFDRLQRMRDESPTGGALGQVTEKEMEQLMSTMGNLDLNQSDSQILFNLKRINDIYSGILAKARVYPNAEKFGFGKFVGSPSDQRKVTDAVNTVEMPEEVKKRYY